MPAELVLKTLSHVWNTLAPLQVRKALMGGLAVAVWKHLRLTQDVDILVGVEGGALDALVDQLQKAGFRPKAKSAVLQLGPQKFIQMLYQPPGSYLDIQVDLFVATGDYAQQALQRTQVASLPGLEVQIDVLSCEDLIIHKLLAGRILDQADAATLLRLNKDQLDFSYLQHWISDLGLKKEWDFVFEEAFPDGKRGS
jgi:hypothetical protein